ncbi:FadR/GntR family transcriptional regulator [Baekduia soli]|nr:FCD domain-containing protein [Baekduia soli]
MDQNLVQSPMMWQAIGLLDCKTGHAREFSAYPCPVSPSRVTVPAAYAVVVEHLRREIQLGRYAPGDKLPPEREHAEQLGVSRVTLREAVRVLEGEGLVHVRRGQTGGTMIRARGTSAQLRRQVRRRLDDVLATQEFRLAIEPLAAARAAQHRKAAAVRELRTAVTDLTSASDIGTFRRADSAFHLTVARNAACPPLERAVEDARIAMFEPLDVLAFDIVLPSAVEAHQAILTAIEDRDPEAARAAMDAHIRTTTGEIKALFPASAS